MGTLAEGVAVVRTISIDGTISLGVRGSNHSDEISINFDGSTYLIANARPAFQLATLRVHDQRRR